MKDSVSILLFSASGNLVLQHRDNKSNIEYPDYWGLISGWIEKDETPIDAISRELSEELECTSLDILKFRGIELFFVDKREDKGWFEHVFMGYCDTPARFLSINEGQSVAEFSISNALDFVKIAPHHKTYLRKYCTQTNHKITKSMNEINNYLELTQLGNVKDYGALETGDGYILPANSNPVGVFHTKEDAKVIALLVFVKDIPRGFHYHKEKIEYMTVLSGKLKCEFSLPDSAESTELILEEGQLIRISPGCIHTYTALEKDVYAIEYAPNKFRADDVFVVK